MKVLLILIAFGLLLYAGYSALRFSGKYQASKKLIEAARGYEREGVGSPSLLVLGDSTAVGVGAARPDDTVAGRLATFMGAVYVENHARSGAVVADMPGQVAKASRDRYDVVLVQIGGNDIIRFHSAESRARALEDALNALPKAERTYLMTAGNVGAATLFPWPVRFFHTRLNLRYHGAFRGIAERLGIIYVNLYEDPRTDPFVQESQRYLSADGLHPSSEGYGLWFNELEASR